MKSIHLLIFLFLLWETASSQDRLSIYDRQTSRPIPRATVRAVGQPVGGYANEDGVFLLSPDLPDSLYVSSIGYYGKTIDLKHLGQGRVFLEPKVSAMDVIIVRTRKSAGRQSFGILDAKKDFVWTSSGYGEEFAQKILLDDSSKIYKLEAVSIAAERFDPEIPVILRIYEIGPDSLPGDEILTRQVLLERRHFRKSKRRFRIELDTIGIVLQSPGCFVGMEWLPVRQKGQRLPSTGIILTDDLDQSLTFTRAFLLGTDKWTEALRIPGQARPSNTIISIEVEVLE